MANKININQNQLYSAAGALDPRFIVDSVDKITSISNAYVGLEVSVIDSEENIIGKYKIKKINSLTKKPLPANEGGYELILEPKDLKYSDGETSFLNEDGNINSDPTIDPLPPHSSSDNGKVLGLDDKGTLTWVSQPDTSGKVDKEQGKGLSTNDYSDTDKNKVNNMFEIPAGASENKVLGYENGNVTWVDKPQDGEKGDKGDKGKDAVNPFKGYYPSGVSKPATGAVGDYLYAAPNDSQSTATATIWYYDANQTPPWTDTGIDVSAVVGVEFGSGQSVPATKIKDENGEEVSGPANLLSGEAGVELNEKIEELKEQLIVSENIINITLDSPYLVSTLDGMYMPTNTIVQNQYTSNYYIALFRLPAGKYKITKTADTSTNHGTLVAKFASESDFALGGIASEIIFVSTGTSQGDELELTLTDETLVSLTYKSNDINAFAKIEEIKPITIKDAVEELDDTVEELSDKTDANTATLESLQTNNEVVYQLPHDLDWFDGYYGYRNFGQYTKILSQDTTFNKIRINGFKNTSTLNIQYKVYITNAGAGIPRDTPIGVIGNNTAEYILVKEGTFSVDVVPTGTTKEIYIDTEPTICPAGYQVVVYMISSVSIRLQGASNDLGNPEETSNRALLCTGDDPFGESSWVAGSWKSTENKGYFSVALTLLSDSPFVLKGNLSEELEKIVPPIVDSEIATNLDIVIPDTVYAIVGTELNIWNDTVSLSIDKGLQSPMNYQIRWYCNKGIITDRCFRFKPKSTIFKIKISDLSATIAVNDTVYIDNKPFEVSNITLNKTGDVTVSKTLTITSILSSVTIISSSGIVTINNDNINYTDGALTSAAETGDYSCTCYIYDVRGKLVSSKTFTIKVLANDTLNSVKNIVYFGDSLGDSAATALYNNFNDSNRFGGTIPNMLGTKGTTNHYEAVGGYKWSSYATGVVPGYRIHVSGVNSLSLGAVYSDGSHNFKIIEINITEGTGNCLLERHYTNPGALIIPSGTLAIISGSGDSTVPYTDAFQESVNPLWNDTTQQLDINQYKQTLVDLGQLTSINDKIDAVSFQFGINDNSLANDLTTLHQYISDLYNCFINDNANCKFIVGLTTSSGNDLNGAGANNGATNNWKSYLENTYKIRKYYLTLLSEFPNLRIATPNLYLDRYYGYSFGTRTISDRYQVDEQYHNNYVHPATSGYNQMADAFLACYVGVLTEE